MMNSIINTTAQQQIDTGNNPAPSHAAMIPMRNAAAPATGDCVTSMIAGKVMTDRVI